MVTIRDIAKLAGVSHGTASNVLNGRGNVSMQKILLVEEAARQLGYSMDERGRMLHREFDRSIAIVLPTLQLERYAVIYATASAYLQERGYTCPLYLTGDVPTQEESALNEIAGRRCQGTLLVTCQPDSSETRDKLIRSGIQIVCLERTTADRTACVDFDAAALADAAYLQLKGKGCHRVTIISGLMLHRNETAFVHGLTSLAEQDGILVRALQTDTPTATIAAFTAATDEQKPDAIVTTSIAYARQVASVLAFRAEEDRPLLLSLSPSAILPAGDGILRVSLNWKRATQTACRMVLGEIEPSACSLLPECTPQQLSHHAIPQQTELNVLMLDEPATYALQKLLPDFERRTGIRVRFAIFPYSELYSMIEHLGQSKLYDVMRMDIMWLSALYRNQLQMFDPHDEMVASIYQPMLTTLVEACCPAPGVYCAFPFAPSVQLQFYRRDLFDDVKVKRQFYESTRTNLTVPEDFDTFLALLDFFRQSDNRFSPVAYGASVVTASPISIVCEFLPIMAATGASIFAAGDEPRLCTDEAKRALEIYLDINRKSWPVPAGQMWNGAVDAFAHGRTAMLNVFTNHAQSIVDLRKSKIAGRIGYAMVPGKHPLLGGGVLGISASSVRQQAALEFIRWACSERISVPFTMLSGSSPCRSIYENEDLLELYPWLSIMPHNFDQAVCRRVPSCLDDYTVETTIGRAVKNALLGITDAGDALRLAQEELLALREARRQR